MFAIVNVDENWNIGNKGELLLHFKEDMQYFREKTIGNICIMGRKTLESFPDAKPLEDRLNIVLTSKVDEYKNKYKEFNNILFFKTKEDVMKFLEKADKDVYVIGGESIYNLFLNDCEKVYVTKMFRTFEADTSFPNLDKNPNFTIEMSTLDLINEKNNLTYRMVVYEKLS